MAVKPLTPAEKTALRERLTAFYSSGDAQQLRRLFELFDRNNDGKITRQELSVVLRGVHTGVTDTKVDDMMNVADLNHDGSIDLREFIAVMERNQ